MTTTKCKELAGTLYNAFERKERNEKNEYGDTAFYSLTKDAPEWVKDAIREAHDGGNIFPNDWIYDACHTMASHMDDTDPDDWDDAISEWADGAVDVYNTDRARWLASHLEFAGIVDEAVEELGHSDQGIHGDIGIGQYVLLERIASALIQAVRDEAENDDE